MNEIYKIQKPIAPPDGALLVYKKGKRDLMFAKEMPVDFKGRLKVYVHAKLIDDVLHIEGEAPEQDW